MSNDLIEPAESPLNDFLLEEEDLKDLFKRTKNPINRQISIEIRCVYPDPQNPDQLKQITRTKKCNSKDKVDDVTKAFLNDETGIPQDKQYYMGYDQLLFKDGTLQECGITQGKTVDLYAQGKNNSIFHNEGLTLVLWSIIPLLFGISLLAFSVIAQNIEETFKSFCLFFGMILLIPSLIVLFIGLVLIPECGMPCYFTGSSWF